MKGRLDCAQGAQTQYYCLASRQASQTDLNVAKGATERSSLDSTISDSCLVLHPNGVIEAELQSQTAGTNPGEPNRIQDWLNRNEYFNLAKQVCREHRLAVFSVCCVLIALIGVLDLWLAVRYSDSILDMEQNPICLYLMQLDPHDLMIFVYGKSAGILTVIGVLIGLFNYWERIAMHVTLAVTFFQFALICYLYVLSDLPHLYRVYID